MMNYTSDRSGNSTIDKVWVSWIPTGIHVGIINRIWTKIFNASAIISKFIMHNPMFI